MISFEEAKKARENNLAQARAAAEKRIDDAIRASKGTTVSVDVGDVDSDVCDSLRDIYRDGGWAVDWTRSPRGDCQRDGPWGGNVTFVLTQPKPYSNYLGGRD